VIVPQSIEHAPLVGPHAHIGQQIRASRTSMGLTLREAARLMGVSMTQLSAFERGDVLPSVLDLLPLLSWASGYVESARKAVRA
jgi:transcriptional regulator with XRE-family HTH domain